MKWKDLLDCYTSVVGTSVNTINILFSQKHGMAVFGANKNLGNALISENYLPLDETLSPTRNQFAFKQYIPEKPTAYGLLVKSLNCGQYSYTYIFHINCGKPTGEPKEYCITGAYNYTTSLVNNL